jgi:hypothetical protein
MYYDEIEEYYPEFKLPNGIVDADSREFAKVFDAPLGSSVLEVGCSEELIAYSLASIGFNVVGIDLRHGYVKDNLVNYTFIKGNLLDIGFNIKFDATILLSTVEHVGLGCYNEAKVPDGDVLAMNKIYGMLKDGGRAYVTVPYGTPGEWLGWRVYDNDAIDKRLIGKFNVVDRKIFASADFKQYKVGDYVDEADVAGNLGPEVSILLVLEKRGEL